MTCTWIVYCYHWSAHVIAAFYYCIHHNHQPHYHDQQIGYYDHQTDLTFELHSQQLIRTLTLLGAGSDWIQQHDKCQQIWLKSNLFHTGNVLWDIDHSHWTQLYHRLNYFPGPQSHPNSQIIDQIVYSLTLGLVPAPEPVLSEYSVFPWFTLRPKFIQNGFIIILGLTCCKYEMWVDFLCRRPRRV